MDYSVLMSVYYKENPDHLRQSMESIFAQTVPSNDFVLVCDGPLTEGLEQVIRQMQQRHGELLHLLRLEKNMGLGMALNRGMACCKNELIARMDSDDIARPDRCEKQLACFAQMPELGICSGIVEEFSESPGQVQARRVLPEEHRDILSFSKKRNPFNHPCVMYRKSEVLAAGGYRDFYLLEDYYLWIRMLMNGTKGRNLPEPLLWMRAGSAMYKRRAGWKYAKSQRALFRYMKEQGWIGTRQYLLALVTRSVSSLLTNRMRETLFRLFLRK